MLAWDRLVHALSLYGAYGVLAQNGGGPYFIQRYMGGVRIVIGAARSGYAGDGMRLVRRVEEGAKKGGVEGGLMDMLLMTTVNMSMLTKYKDDSKGRKSGGTSNSRGILRFCRKCCRSRDR